jgi:hypothetical protein
MNLTKIPTAQEIADRIRSISDNLLEVAKDIAAALDLNPALADELQACGINRNIIHRLERLGRGQIHTSLVFSTTPGGLRLVSAPMSEQQNAITNGVEVLDENETDTRLIPVHELSQSQASQCIARGAIRSISEQRTWIRKKKSKVAPATVREQDFKVTSDAVTIHRPGKYSREIVLSWIIQMG